MDMKPTGKLAEMKKELDALITAPGTDRDQHFGRIACLQALKAARSGNYGVGALLVDPVGKIVALGHNKAFYPYFQSSRHAEMVTMDSFERRFREITNLAEHELYTSTEPCPMCIARLVISGVGSIKYVAPDPGGGMVQHMAHLPTSFQNLARSQRFSLANCSPKLQAIATDIFLLNLQALRAELFKRRPALQTA